MIYVSNPDFRKDSNTFQVPQQPIIIRILVHSFYKTQKEYYVYKICCFTIENLSPHNLQVYENGPSSHPKHTEDKSSRGVRYVTSFSVQMKNACFISITF